MKTARTAMEHTMNLGYIQGDSFSPLVVVETKIKGRETVYRMATRHMAEAG